MPVELSVDQQALQAVGRALKGEVDGKALRRDLIRNMKAPTVITVNDLKVTIRAAGTGSGSPPITQAIALKIKPSVRLSGRNTGVSIRAGKTTTVRGFSQAAKQFNRPSFRHRVYGSDTWVEQVGKPEWFDGTTKEHHDEMRAGIFAAIEQMKRRIAKRARSRT